ncbi:FG-GAP repeat domain-containing protein [Runella sp.]|uniref:FG-GAP repeat domain-containing protein n=1 Tax=Runella sp. TaxID=1960881 RepID=UPI003D0CFA22
MASIKIGLIAVLFLCEPVRICNRAANRPDPNCNEFLIRTDSKQTYPLAFTNYAIDSTTSGKRLALKYCQSCHLFPEPGLLDKKTWVGSVLPNMGLRLGIKQAGKNPYDGLTSREDEKILHQLGTYPETALLSVAEWESIVNYYESEAPTEPLPQKAHPPIADQLPQFKATPIKISDKPVPKTTLVKFDPASSQLYVGNDPNELYVVDSAFQLKTLWNLDSPPTDIYFPKNAKPRLLTIGTFSPSDQKLGKIISLDTSTTETSVYFDSLPRPVQFVAADLTLDGKEDLVICGFGNNAGKLFWYDGFSSAKEHILKALPGARRVEVRDFNNDKKPDLMVLMAQAHEEVSIFYNQGNGNFKEKTVLKFQPSYGVSYFELVDFNKDGFQDILLTNGDNWDYSAIQKNYHGIRIYLNDGRDNFKEAWFYPLYGTSKAMARDFDNDGDIDIAAISFYSDLEKPEQGFVYLSNKGTLTFEAFSTPEAASGKWLTMEVADLDHDGDVDIVLGSYFHTVGELTTLMFKGITSFPQLLVLTNRQK